jgi:aminopeptidase 2
MYTQNLHEQVKPTHYDLRIEPDLETGQFGGAVTIDIKILKTTTSIAINVHKLEILSTTIYNDDGVSLPLLGFERDEGLQTLCVIVEEPLVEGARIRIQHTFSGQLCHHGHGFHMPFSTLGTPSMAATNLEPRWPRSVFPCFDAPAFKTTFSITLIVSQKSTCLSNMPIKSSTKSQTQLTKTVIFHKTPELPIYLVCFAVGSFNCIESRDFRFPLRAYAPLNYPIDDTRASLELAGRTIVALEQKLGQDCGLVKLDLLAIPSADANMENWGLICLTSQVLLQSPMTSAKEALHATRMVGHEIAHQWFGNLVTMKSWDCFWLKEAFAEWIEVQFRAPLDQGGYEAEAWLDYSSIDLQMALKFDSSKYSHALEPSMDEKSNEPFFDKISYQKGCLVLRMLETYLSTEVFLDGVRKFLARHAYITARPDDFWNALTSVSDVHVGAFMNTWTKEIGYPLLTIEEHPSTNTLTITQNRFRSFPLSSHDPAEREVIWPIPLKLLTKTGTFNVFIDSKTRSIPLPQESYMLNTGSTTYCRVSYPISRLRILAEDASQGFLSVADRISLVSDTAALIFANPLGNTIHITHLLNLLHQLDNEDSFYVWKVIIDALNDVEKCLLFEKRRLRQAWRLFRKELVRKCLYREGRLIVSDGQTECRFKALMFENSGGDEKTLEAAKVMFNAFLEGDEKAINPNILTGVFSMVLADGGKKVVCSCPFSLHTHYVFLSH